MTKIESLTSRQAAVGNQGGEKPTRLSLARRPTLTEKLGLLGRSGTLGKGAVRPPSASTPVAGMVSDVVLLQYGQYAFPMSLPCRNIRLEIPSPVWQGCDKPGGLLLNLLGRKDAPAGLAGVRFACGCGVAVWSRPRFVVALFSLFRVGPGAQRWFRFLLGPGWGRLSTTFFFSARFPRVDLWIATPNAPNETR